LTGVENGVKLVEQLWEFLVDFGSQIKTFWDLRYATRNSRGLVARDLWLVSRRRKGLAGIAIWGVELENKKRGIMAG
jgi:hypothetical protein